MKKRKQHFLKRIKQLWSDSYLRLRLTCRVAMPTGQGRTISVAIPFYNNSKMGHLALFNILNDPRIEEIVVLDDASDVDEFNKLKRKLAPFSKKIRLFRRDQNWGAFANKIQCVEMCESDWVILLDYDNTLPPEYIDSLFKEQNWETDKIYCSAYAYPNFDFRKELAGKCIGLKMASSLVKARKFNGPFFNDGNYFLCREQYLKILKPFWNYSVAASDVAFSNYLWMSNGKSLKVLADSWYIHRVHEKSTWTTHSQKSQLIFDLIKRRVRDEIPPDSESIHDDIAVIEQKWVEPVPISPK